MAIGVGDDATLVLRVINVNDVVVFGKLGFHSRKICLRHLETDESDADVVLMIGFSGGVGVFGLGDPQFETVDADDDAVVDIVQMLKAKLLLVPRETARKVAHDDSNDTEILWCNHCFAPYAMLYCSVARRRAWMRLLCPCLQICLHTVVIKGPNPIFFQNDMDVRWTPLCEFQSGGARVQKKGLRCPIQLIADAFSAASLRYCEVEDRSIVPLRKHQRVLCERCQAVYHHSAILFSNQLTRTMFRRVAENEFLDPLMTIG